MTPRAVIGWSASTVAVVVIDANPVTRVLLLLAALNVVLTLLPRGVALGGYLRAAALGAVLATVISLLLDHTGTHVIAHIPAGVPILGGPLTLEGLVFGAATGIGLAAALIAALPLATALQATDIVDSLPRRLERIALLLTISLGLFPRVRRSLTGIAEAQRMRGQRSRGLRGAAAVVVPVSLAAVEDSMVMTQAMEARGFGSGLRTVWRPVRRTWTGRAVIAAALGAVLLTVAARMAGWNGDWFPFPSLTAPPVEPAGVAVAMLCAVPALLGRRR